MGIYVNVIYVVIMVIGVYVSVINNFVIVVGVGVWVIVENGFVFG